MKKLVLLFVIVSSFTVQAKDYIVSIDFLVKSYCANHALHITQESCVEHVNTCIGYRIATRHPVLISQDKRAAMAFLSCSHELSANTAYTKPGMIHLKFEDIDDRERWLVWYLDRGGEEQSGFLVQDWDWHTMILEKDPDYYNN